jgi:hypothetical protein
MLETVIDGLTLPPEKIQRRMRDVAHVEIIRPA